MKQIFILLIFTVLGYANAIGVEYTVKTCLVANVKASVKVGTSTVTFQNVGATDSGDCKTSSNKSSLLIPFKGSDNSSLSVTMNFGLQTDTVYLDELSVEYDDAGSAVTLTKAVNQPLSKSDEYYVCNKEVTYVATGNGKEATVTFTYLKVQAFGVVNSTYSTESSVCASVSSTTDSPSSTATPTTAKPTTTKPATHSTTKPATHSTTKPATHSTAKPTTTPAKVTTVKPVPAAKPVNGSVEDTKTGVVCILVQFTGMLSVPYTTTKGTNETYTYPIASVKSVKGSCGNDSQSIVFTLHNNWLLSMTFAMKSTKKASRRLLADGSYFMSEVELNYDEATIPGAKGGKKVDTLTSKDLNSADVGESYKCKSGEKLTMKHGVKFNSTDMQVEAFRTEKSKDFSKNQKVCSGDLSPGSNIVPIVVGVVLALLVVVIIIAYLIGRRRTQAGYQSV